MYEWRGWAKFGFWEHISAEDFLGSADRSEISELTWVLEQVVPVIHVPLGGDGPLGPKRPATFRDEKKLLQHIRRGSYDRALRKVSERFISVSDPDSGEPMDTYLACHTKTHGGDEGFKLHQLKRAANNLEILNAGLPEDPNYEWLHAAESDAIKAIESEGVTFRGLDETFLKLVEKKKRKVVSPKRDGIWEEAEEAEAGAYPLVQIADENAQWLRTSVFHAVNVLLGVRTLNMHIRLLPPACCNEDLWTPENVSRHMVEATALSCSIGYHWNALDDHYLQKLAQGKKKQEKPLLDDNIKRSEAQTDRDSEIVKQMGVLVRRGCKVMPAARKVQKDMGLSTSPSRIQGIYYKALKKQK
ncbi:hypothetical protein BCF46_2368 [Litoreibacter meonggei]|uniref:Uncharacterized protein n=2 Tax=Litoreibacter meonggei TaxID=1049199 RepID=A0A497W7E4_9RHOB|nr:hypothetical protein BCF46_2368 [Litoreibacter meonggei]